MPWEIPIVKEKALEEFYKKAERIPDPIIPPYYDPPMTYFNNSKFSLGTPFVPYDLFYNFEEGFDIKSARDDRRSLQPMFEKIFKEEEFKYIPVTTQLNYGRPLLCEKTLDWSSRHGRSCPTKDFYRLQGINISPELEKQPEH